jgi:hypothetical protein
MSSGFLSSYPRQGLPPFGAFTAKPHLFEHIRDNVRLAHLPPPQKDGWMKRLLEHDLVNRNVFFLHHLGLLMLAMASLLRMRCMMRRSRSILSRVAMACSTRVNGFSIGSGLSSIYLPRWGWYARTPFDAGTGWPSCLGQFFGIDHMQLEPFGAAALCVGNVAADVL